MTRLPFGFARDQQVVVDGTDLIIGPAASSLGIREARRRAARPLALVSETQSGFEQALSRVYQSKDQTEDSSELFFDLEATETVAVHRDLLDEVEDAPVIEMVNQLLRRAVQSGASDLHVEPHEQGLRVRMRKDGFLQTIMDRKDVPVRRILSRLKVMSGLDIAETRLPQDGRIPIRLGGRQIDMRVSTLPSNYGERIVLRILDRSTGLLPLEDLGLKPDQIAMLERLSALPNGIILATGPTGSGKTTTLYSLLKLSNLHERNIVTVEDPIEYDLPSTSQTQINADIGMTFAAGLRATLRQDPDVILVGEIRDGETATVAAQAALTGHLVFSSLHANGSIGAITRLRDLGLDDFLIASSLRAVIAQRLLRRLCNACKTSHSPTASERELFTQQGLDIPDAVFAPVGCPQCFGTGYAGRVGIFEMVECDEALRTAIDRGASEVELRAGALDPSRLLIGQGLMRVIEGKTSLAETLRVVGDTI